MSSNKAWELAVSIVERLRYEGLLVDEYAIDSPTDEEIAALITDVIAPELGEDEPE